MSCDTSPSEAGPTTERAATAELEGPAGVGYDVVALLGQSNMIGVAGSAESPSRNLINNRIYSYAATGAHASQLARASDPLGHPGTVQTTVVGPGMSFARGYTGMIPGNRRVLLVPAAYGGTGIASGTPRWDPTTNWPDDTSNLYNRAIAQTQAAIIAGGPNTRLVAALWIQGENDVDERTAPARYQTLLEQLIDGFRSRLAVPNLPFVIGSMTPEFIANSGAEAVAIDAIHQATATRKPYTSYVAGPAGMGAWDNVHYSNAGAREMGRRLLAGYTSALTNSSPSNIVAANPPTPPSGFTPPNVSEAPSIGTATAGNRTASVPFTPRTVTTTSSIVTASTGQTATGTSSPLTVEGLTNGTAVTFRVTATNGMGTSAPSAASTSVTQTVPPEADSVGVP